MKNDTIFSSTDARHAWMDHVSESRIEREIKTKKFQDFVAMIYEDGLNVGKTGYAA